MSGSSFQGWRTDPTGRHQLRYHTGYQWTDHVSDLGVVGSDAYEATPDFVSRRVGDTATPEPDLTTHLGALVPTSPLMTEVVGSAISSTQEPGPPYPPPPRIAVRSVRLRWVKRWHLLTLSLVVLGGLIAVGLLGLQQRNVAQEWQHRDQQAIVRNQRLTAGLTATEARVKTLNKNMAALQAQLSTVANQKEKALDQNALLSQAVTAAGAVASELNGCVDDLNGVLNDITESLNTGFIVSSLANDANTAQTVCTAAQSDNQQLQQTLAGG